MDSLLVREADGPGVGNESEGDSLDGLQGSFPHSLLRTSKQNHCRNNWSRKFPNGTPHFSGFGFGARGLIRQIQVPQIRKCILRKDPVGQSWQKVVAN